MDKARLLLSMALLAVVVCGFGEQTVASEHWITHPAAKSADAENKAIALQFRREVTFDKVPQRLQVRVSADNRYILYVNGGRVAAGPSRGDLAHWRVQDLDLAPFLRRGSNVVAAQVWNDASFAPMAQISAKTAFLVQALTAEAAGLETGPEWRVRVDPSRTIQPGQRQIWETVGRQDTYYVAGAPETHDGAQRVWDWISANSSARDWSAAVAALEPQETAPWSLVADPLPQMRYDDASGGKLVRAEGVKRSRFPRGPAVVMPNSEAVLLIDAGKVEAAYPQLTTSGGRGAQVTVTFTEALYGPDKQRLADRAQVVGGQVLGLTDTFRPDGGKHRQFETFWWRVWRFAEVRVKTGAEPLTLESFERRLTGYPFQLQARFVSDDAELNRIWDIGWDTVRLDAHETYMDTAYWEQLQYAGDTRLMALITYALTQDSRLPQQAIQAIDDSKVDGLPQSRWPSREQQSIPPFALLWIGILHDYWMYRPETDVLARSLPGMRSVLTWYAGYIDGDGLIGKTPGWQFIDWRPGLSNYPPDNNGSDDRCIVSLMYLGALRHAADIERALGNSVNAQANSAATERLASAVHNKCWSPERGLYADGPDQKIYSQHANALAVLYDVAPESERAAILERTMVRDRGIDAPEGITGTTYYFAFYLARALDRAGLGDRYFDLLKNWRALLAQNFTTWPENPDPTRSDSHAWSGHPTYDLLTLVAGVQPASPGFGSVRIRPHLGSLKQLNAAVAHPRGLVETRYDREGDTLIARITLPPELTGTFEYGGRSLPLRPGMNSISAPAQ